jgi:hypothetical protein
MEEKATETNRNESATHLIAIDELYHKIVTQQKLSRCKSAIPINNNKEYFNNNKNRNNFILNSRNIKNNNNKSIDLPFFTPKNEIISYKKAHTINLSDLLKANDSKRIDSTKQSTGRVRMFSRSPSSNYSLINNKSKINRKKILSKNRALSVINIKANLATKRNDNNKNKTLIDLTIQKLMRKLKMIEFNKVMDYKNKENIKKAQIYDLIPSLLFYTKQKEKDNEKKKIAYNNNFPLNKKNTNKNQRSFYPIKYTFFDNVMNDIQHVVNFIDIKNREEMKQNTIKAYDKNFKKMEEFKSFGYELNPEVLEKKYQNEKQNYIKSRYKEILKEILDENIKSVAFQKMLSPKNNKNYIPEYKRTKSDLLLYKKNIMKIKNKAIEKKTFIIHRNKRKENLMENNDKFEAIEEFNSQKNMVSVGNNIEFPKQNDNKEDLISKSKNVDDIKNKTLFNINKVSNDNTTRINIGNTQKDEKEKKEKKNKKEKKEKCAGREKELNRKNKYEKVKKRLKNYNKIIIIERVDNFCLKGNNEYINETFENSYTYIQTIETNNNIKHVNIKKSNSSKSITKYKKTININNNIESKKKALIFDDNLKKITSKIEIKFKSTKKNKKEIKKEIKDQIQKDNSQKFRKKFIKAKIKKEHCKIINNIEKISNKNKKK